MSWRTVTASVEGPSHRRTSTPCQDYGLLEQYPHGLVLGALADGAGSARYSAFGARVCVKSALGVLREAAWDSPPEEFRIMNHLKEIISDIQSETREVAKKIQDRTGRKGLSWSDFNCTLLAFASGPGFFAALQIGDGFIVYRSKDEPQYRIAFTPDKGEYFNQACFVQGSDPERDGQILVLPETPEFIFVSSDGLETVALELAGFTPFQPFFSWFESLMNDPEHSEYARDEVLSFLKSERLEKKSDDDKTVLTCLNIN